MLRVLWKNKLIFFFLFSIKRDRRSKTTLNFQRLQSPSHLLETNIQKSWSRFRPSLSNFLDDEQFWEEEKKARNFLDDEQFWEEGKKILFTYVGLYGNTASTLVELKFSFGFQRLDLDPTSYLFLFVFDMYCILSVHGPRCTSHPVQPS